MMVDDVWENVLNTIWSAWQAHEKYRARKRAVSARKEETRAKGGPAREAHQINFSVI